MSAGDEIMTPLLSWEGLMGLVGALGLGGVLTALVQRPTRRSVDAAAAKDEATGEAAVITSMANAFTGTTGALREEIERMQSMLNELRSRVVEAEAEIRASAAREAGLERIVADQRSQLEIAHEDIIRLRTERNTAVARSAQQDGEIRQLNAVLAARDRVTGV